MTRNVQGDLVTVKGAVTDFASSAKGWPVCKEDPRRIVFGRPVQGLGLPPDTLLGGILVDDRTTETGEPWFLYRSSLLALLEDFGAKQALHYAGLSIHPFLISREALHARGAFSLWRKQTAPAAAWVRIVPAWCGVGFATVDPSPYGFHDTSGLLARPVHRLPYWQARHLDRVWERAARILRMDVDTVTYRRPDTSFAGHWMSAETDGPRIPEVAYG